MKAFKFWKDQYLVTAAKLEPSAMATDISQNEIF
jgi:hypothetical protein